MEAETSFDLSKFTSTEHIRWSGDVGFMNTSIYLWAFTHRKWINTHTKKPHTHTKKFLYASYYIALRKRGEKRQARSPCLHGEGGQVARKLKILLELLCLERAALDEGCTLKASLRRGAGTWYIRARSCAESQGLSAGQRAWQVLTCKLHPGQGVARRPGRLTGEEPWAEYFEVGLATLQRLSHRLRWRFWSFLQDQWETFGGKYFRLLMSSMTDQMGICWFYRFCSLPFLWDLFLCLEPSLLPFRPKIPLDMLVLRSALYPGFSLPGLWGAFEATQPPHGTPIPLGRLRSACFLAYGKLNAYCFWTFFGLHLWEPLPLPSSSPTFRVICLLCHVHLLQVNQPLPGLCSILDVLSKVHIEVISFLKKHITNISSTYSMPENIVKCSLCNFNDSLIMLSILWVRCCYTVLWMRKSWLRDDRTGSELRLECKCLWI